MKSIQVYKRAFRQWQRRPHEVAPMSDSRQVCSTCGTSYVGNYCPRCGQSAKIGRYSFKKAFLMFLDVWGLGNRGMFHTLRDLLLRPGYMIRDYLSGMQMAYFPPFKMFFLLSTLSILVGSGLNIRCENSISTKPETALETPADAPADSIAVAIAADSLAVADSLAQAPAAVAKKPSKAAAEEWNMGKSVVLRMVKKVIGFLESFPTLFSLFWLVLMSVFLYPFFRKSVLIPDLHYSEFLIAIVYIANMYSIYSVVLDFFCLNNVLLGMVVLSLSLIPLKQLSGYGWWNTAARCLLALFLFALFMVAIVALGIYLVKTLGI